MTHLIEASNVKDKSIWQRYLENNVGIVGIVFSSIGFTNYLFANKIVNRNLSLVILAIGGMLIILHYINHMLIANLE